MAGKGLGWGRGGVEEERQGAGGKTKWLGKTGRSRGADGWREKNEAVHVLQMQVNVKASGEVASKGSLHRKEIRERWNPK